MLVSILIGLGLAMLAPMVHRIAGRAAGSVLALGPLGMFVYFLTLAPSVFAGNPVHQRLAWAPQVGVDLNFYLDGLSLLFALLITGIGTLIVFYGGSYLQGHADRGRFFAWLLIFMAAMLGLVVADNIIVLFIFWELTSISSYFLIGFDHEREKARKSALQALLVTGSGGLVLFAGLVLMSIATGATDVSTILAGGDTLREHSLYVPILILLLIGAFTKSAQFPFHFWLPNAMEAPTPVSAYLHSSTMVKAGVYLLARMSPAMGGTDLWFWLLTLFGGTTMVVGAFLAVQQVYLKKILAYSTVSALGILVFLLGLGAAGGDPAGATPEEDLALYAGKAFAVFLLAHALYKATLFLVAGTITHETGEKDVTKLGGLRKAMPMTFAAGILAALSMAGFPPFFGFLGKELLIEATLAQPGLAAVLTLFTVLVGVLFVVVSFLVAIGPFFGEVKHTPQHPHEAPLPMWIGPITLASCGLVFGLLPWWTAEPLVLAVVASVTGDPEVDFYLTLWHGFNLALMLGGLALALGITLFMYRDRVLTQLCRLQPFYRYGPESWYDLTLKSVLGTASWQTRVLQSGYLRRYLQIIVITTVALIGYALLRFGTLPMRPVVSEPVLQQGHLFKLVAAALILFGTFGAVHFRTRLTAIANLGIVGFGVALVYVLYGAPDLAITQFLVETLTVILFVLVFYHVPEVPRISQRWERARDAVIAGSAGLVMGLLVLVATAVNDQRPISDYFLVESVPGGKGRNIVNVILVDFRAIDTLGEICVLAIAAVGVFALLKFRRRLGVSEDPAAGDALVDAPAEPGAPAGGEGGRQP